MAMIDQKQAAIMERVLSEDMYLSPLKFALFAYPWGTGDLKAFKGPRRWQAEVMMEMEEYLRDALAQKRITNTFPDYFREAVASGRGPGKSALIGMLSHWFLSTRIGSSTWVAANGEPQLRTKTFPEIAKWVARGINSEFFDITSTMIMPSKWFKEYIESPQGLGRSTRYYYIAGQLWSAENPDAFAGAHNFDGEFAIFDEGSAIPENIWTVQEGVFTEDIADRFWMVFSNPRQNTGAFFDCFHKDKEQWRTRQIDSRTVEGINHAPFESIIRKFGEDSDEARVEVYGQFPSVGDDQFISPKLVNAALEREPVWDKDAEVVMGVDPARFGNDRSVIVVRRGRVLEKVMRFTGLDTMALTGKVIEAIKSNQPDLTIVDEGGLGAGVYDRLKEQGFKVRGVQFGSRADNPAAYFNKRAEMWGTMKEWLRSASIGSLSDNPERDNKEIFNDLTAPRYELSSNGSIQLESKAKMKKRGVASPDVGDSIALSLSCPVGDGILSSEKFKMWKGDLPVFDKVVQSYHGAYTEKTGGQNAAVTVWGVFDNKGEPNIMLLDMWLEKMSYAQLRQKVIDDWHTTYGDQSSGARPRQKKADVVLMGEGVGETMVIDLRNANVGVSTYKNGDADLIERAHQTLPVLDTGCVYVPQSKKAAGVMVRWSQPLLDQCDRFPNDIEDELIDTMTRALLFIRDNRWLELKHADDDDLDDEMDYHLGKRPSGGRINPYAA